MSSMFASPSVYQGNAQGKFAKRRLNEAYSIVKFRSYTLMEASPHTLLHMTICQLPLDVGMIWTAILTP
jgi:hypothetical protein